MLFARRQMNLTSVLLSSRSEPRGLPGQLAVGAVGQDQMLLLQNQGSQQVDQVAWRGATREPASGDSSLQEALTANEGTFTKDSGVISKDDE